MRLGLTSIAGRRNRHGGEAPGFNLAADQLAPRKRLQGKDIVSLCVYQY